MAGSTKFEPSKRHVGDPDERLAPDVWIGLSILLAGVGLIVLSTALFMRAA